MNTIKEIQEKSSSENLSLKLSELKMENNEYDEINNQ
jgi:hypothetical protein